MSVTVNLAGVDYYESFGPRKFQEGGRILTGRLISQGPSRWYPSHPAYHLLVSSITIYQAAQSKPSVSFLIPLSSHPHSKCISKCR